MNKQIRFFYDNSWTRWFNPDEDLSFIRTLNFEKAEVIEEVSKEQAADFLSQQTSNTEK